MVPTATISLSRPVWSTSEILSRSLVTRLRISPALFWSKKRRGRRLSFCATWLRRESTRLSATLAIR